MKKHLGLLFLFVIQNACAMELDPLAMTLKYDEKCKLVAKYVYKYPQGEKDREAVLIKHFLNDTKSKRAALSRSVNRYKNMLHNMDAQDLLHNMYTANLPCDIKKNILAQVLWGYAAQYYVMYNTCKFVSMETGLIPSSCYAWPAQYYMPYFLEEILERDNRYVFLSTTKLDDNFEVSAYNDFRIRYSHLDHKNNSCRYNDSEIDMFCCMKSIYGDNKLCCMPIKSTIGTLKDLVLFLETKALRVLALKQSFNKSVEKVARMKDKEGINAFIQLLTLYKALPKDIVSMYKCEIPRSIPMMLEELLPLYEREINRKRIEKSAISGLQHLS